MKEERVEGREYTLEYGPVDCENSGPLEFVGRTVDERIGKITGAGGASRA